MKLNTILNFRRSNKNGSTLIIVLVVSSLVMIMLATAFAVSASHSKTVYNNRNQEQAYLTSKSALTKVVQSLSSNSDFSDYIEDMPNNSTRTTVETEIDGMGLVKFTIKKDNEGQVTIIAKTAYQGETSQAAVILNKTEGTPPTTPMLFDSATVSFGVSSFSNKFYSTGNAISNVPMTMPNQSHIQASVYVKGSFEMCNSSSVIQGYEGKDFTVMATDDISIVNSADVQVNPLTNKAFIYSLKNINITNHSSVGSSAHKINMYCTGLSIENNTTLFSDIYVMKTQTTPIVIPCVNLENSFTLNGDLHVDGNATIDKGSPTINGNIYVAGTLELLNTVEINGDVYCDTLIGGSGATINGTLHCKSSNVNWNESTDASKLTIKESDIPEFITPEEKMQPYSIPAEEYIDYSAFTSAPTYDVGSGPSISKSCILTGSAKNKKITINTKDKPIWIKLNNCEFKNTQLKIVHDSSYPDTPVYFVVPKDKTVSLEGSEVITQETRNMIDLGKVFNITNSADSSKPVTYGQNVFWLMEEGSSVSASNDSFLEGYFYGPKANFSVKNVPKEEFKFSYNGKDTQTDTFSVAGALIVKDIDMSNGGSILYLTPKQNGMPGALTPASDESEETEFVWNVEQYVRH